MSTSATGGYLNKPQTTKALPNDLTLDQFLNTVLAGVSGIDGKFVRPKWQPDPPKNPERDVTWIAFGITNFVPEASSYIGVRADGSSISSRHEKLEIQVSFYGPKAIETYGLLRDGFQVQQNLEALRKASMGFQELGNGSRVPDLINEKWVNRIEATLVLTRQVLRTYPILTFLSVNGTVHTVVGDEDYLLNFKTETPEGA